MWSPEFLKQSQTTGSISYYCYRFFEAMSDMSFPLKLAFLYETLIDFLYLVIQAIVIATLEQLEMMFPHLHFTTMII